MTPAADERLLRFVGDRITVSIAWSRAQSGWSAFLRTNLGRAARMRDAVVAGLCDPRGGSTFAGAAWRDIPMRRVGEGWEVDLPLTEVGFFRAKPYLADADGRQRWPAGGDLGISVHPDAYRTANTIYCAFPRMFGRNRALASTAEPVRDDLLKTLDQHGYTVIPPSGTLRDLCRELPHIVDRLGCHILHLLPIGPTPATYARFGRFGSPYAQQDLTAIDPALVEFDRIATAVDQFRELTAAAHARDCRVFLDIVINHTGWGSTLQDAHPDWFRRNADGTFHSPGAWGTTWEDLVELDHHDPRHARDLWEAIADSLITWCRRGVDGFRCDAGYMVPVVAWQYITARVRQEFPDCVFLLEGLGGAWEATETLLADGGMQWAYSELFQNFDARSIAGYLDHCHQHAAKRGILVHYSETHDNQRLAARGRAWSLFRNRLCALTSHAGTFGFTAGVEWLADEKLEVHQARGLRWGAADNLVDELAVLNRLLISHPCFFDDARYQRLTAPDAPAYAALRSAGQSDGGEHRLLVLANPDADHAQTIELPLAIWKSLGAGAAFDLLGQPLPIVTHQLQRVLIQLPPLACLALAERPVANGAGDQYRHARAQAAWAYACLARVLSDHLVGPADWRTLAAWGAEDPVRFLAAINRLDAESAADDLLTALHQAAAVPDAPPVVHWTTADLRRVVPVPTGCWILVQDPQPFTLTVTTIARPGATPLHLESVPVADGFVAAIAPSDQLDTVEQELELVRGGVQVVRGRLVRLASGPAPMAESTPDLDGVALLTNGRGGMTRLGIDLGRIQSKYDCLLGANLHASAPSDRHVLAKRLRIWAVADGFITPLDRHNLAEFTAGPPATWRFLVNAGDGRTVPITLVVDLLNDRNTVVVRLERPDAPPLWGSDLPDAARVFLTIRVDLEDRSFHGETKRTPETDRHFAQHTATLDQRLGFRFHPATDRQVSAWVELGRYHADPEWSVDLPHPIEAGRGQTATGDCWSPGWFEVPLHRGDRVHLVVDAEAADPEPDAVAAFAEVRIQGRAQSLAASGLASDDAFGRQLLGATTAFLARRDGGRTVIAGYPWFLDWGRDTFIAARGLLAGGFTDDVRHLLATFGRYEQHGTLPNLLNGDRAENRDTSDAPLWFTLVAEELADLDPRAWELDCGGRTLRDVVRSIAVGYLAGTQNGIRVDGESALVWSPPHFTWMDTNHPAGTPRAGYPIEIQALWIRLLRSLDRLGVDPAAGHPGWSTLANRALQSLLGRFWIRERGWFADQLATADAAPAAQAQVDDALRPNQLFAISLGIVRGDLARQAVAACERHLLIPGAIRTLAPLPVTLPLDIRSADGRPLNDPWLPYWSTYTGDEDTRRKPAYHNGTAWLWPYPSFCEAFALAWDRSPTALATATAYLGAMDRWLNTGCIGHLPEIADGDAPHAQRGCDAQAWSATEALRVWRLLRGWNGG